MYKEKAITQINHFYILIKNIQVQIIIIVFVFSTILFYFNKVKVVRVYIILIFNRFNIEKY